MNFLVSKMVMGIILIVAGILILVFPNILGVIVGIVLIIYGILTLLGKK